MTPHDRPAKRVALLAAPLLAACALASSASAAPPQTQAGSNHKLRETIHVLASVKKTLKMADHDYGGHRAKAVHDVGAAEHQLRLALKAVHKKKPGTGKPGKGTTPREPQRLSDAQLAEAIPVLRETITFLETAKHDYGGHKAHAIRDLRATVVQLEKALKFSKKFNKDKP